jgi:hypothetical protein
VCWNRNENIRALEAQASELLADDDAAAADIVSEYRLSDSEDEQPEAPRVKRTKAQPATAPPKAKASAGKKEKHMEQKSKIAPKAKKPTKGKVSAAPADSDSEGGLEFEMSDADSS